MRAAARSSMRLAPAGLARDHDVLVAGVRQPCPGHWIPIAATSRFLLGDRGRRWLPRRYESGRGVVSHARAFDGDGPDQRRHGDRSGRRPAGDCRILGAPLAMVFVAFGRSVSRGRSGGRSPINQP